MQEKMYNDFEALIKESQRQFEYASDHFSELMNRPIAHIRYGPPVYGPGFAWPSCTLTSDCQRVLKQKTRRKEYKAYYFNSEWDLLFSRDFSDGILSCTLLHFWSGDTKYARYFLRDTNDFYSSTVFSVKYNNRQPIRCAFASSSRLYVEYFKEKLDEEGNKRTECNWFNYYPNRKISEHGIPLSRSAPFGACNSPVMFGSFSFEPTIVFL